MTYKDKEKLVKLISSGHNTYRELKVEFPHMNESAWQYIGNSMTGRKDVAFSDKTCSPTEHPKKLAGSDTFRLTEYGEDILYQLKKERKDNILLWFTAICGLIAAITGILALIR